MTARQTDGRTFCVLSFLDPTLYHQHNYQHNYNQQHTTNTFSSASFTLCTNMSNIELKIIFLHVLLMLLVLDLFLLLLLLLLRPLLYYDLLVTTISTIFNSAKVCLHVTAHFTRLQVVVESSHQVILLSNNM